jgi:transforming growth factor-beta-induced protein
MKMNLCFFNRTKKWIGTMAGLLVINLSVAQTNVFDNIIAVSPDHTYLAAAITQQNLQGALQNPAATLTVFAPTNAAFDALAASLNTDIAGLLALPNLTDILLYHVLGTTVVSGNLSNGITPQPLNASNTIKITVTQTNQVFANQAQVTTPNLTANNGVVHVTNGVLLPNTTVVDLAINNGFNILTAAVIQQELVPALSNPFGTFTVFAPTDAAFADLADELGVQVSDLLDLENLTDVLLYHVLGVEVPSSAVTNGLIATPLNEDNTIKMTVTSAGDVYANHAQVVLVDVEASNGVVHAIDAVILPSTTVVDVAINNAGFTILTTAVVQQELLPVLTNPFSTFTVLAPTDAAFTALLSDLGITAEQLLESADLTDYLLYHVFDSEILSSDLANGLIAEPLSETNTIKVTVTGSGDVFFNHAEVVLANVEADNGVVHAIDAVILPVNTVVDVAIDNNFTYLTTALIQEELVPTLSNPFAEFTVFAPTNQAFEELAAALSTDIAGLLALENLTTVLLYHVVAGTVASTDLTNGTVNTLADLDVTVNITGGVTINNSNVTLPDVAAFNGIVHVIDRVLVPGGSPVSIDDFDNVSITAYPNPSSTVVSFTGLEEAELSIVDINGSVVFTGKYTGNPIDISDLSSGMYFIYISSEQNASVIRLSVK